MKIIEKNFVFEGTEAVPSCHASSVLVDDSGKKLVAYFAGTAEGERDVLIYCSRYENGKWSAPYAVTPDGGVQHWNPVLFSDDGKTVTLFYKYSFPIADWYTRVMTSTDFGKTWTWPRELIEGDRSGGRGPVKNKPLRISNGNILAPGSTERGPWRCFIDVFDGNSWEKCDIPVNVDSVGEVNVIQPTLWESEPGHIHALMRSNRGRMYRSDSNDFGKTWCEIYQTDMPNPNAGFDCVRLSDGRIVLVCNPVGENFGERSPLSVFLSTDNGVTFTKALDLETEQGCGEFSYPAIICHGDRLHVTYTYKRKKIVYLEISL